MKTRCFRQKKLYLVEPSSGTNKYVKNWPIFGKCCVLRIKIKSLVSARFPWSFTINLPGCARLARILHESCEAFVWKRLPPKSRGALSWKCSACGVCKRFTLMAPVHLPLKDKGSVILYVKSKFPGSLWAKLQMVLELRFKSEFCHKTMELWGELMSTPGA